MPKNYNYTTKDGDSFDTVALKFYDEEKLSHHIILANPDYSDVIVFPGGVNLKVPLLPKEENPDTVAPWRR